MTPETSSQTMKAATAAKKLDVLLQATPAEFQNRLISRAELNELLATPPQWLVELRKDGPHPRQVVARKLGVSIAGLARGSVDEPLTTEEIQELLAAPPEWLVQERATQAAVRAENHRVNVRNAQRTAGDGR